MLLASKSGPNGPETPQTRSSGYKKKNKRQLTFQKIEEDLFDLAVKRPGGGGSAHASFGRHGQNEKSPE